MAGEGFFLNSVFPDPSWELPKIEAGGGSEGVKEATEDGGRPAGVVVDRFGAYDMMMAVRLQIALRSEGAYIEAHFLGYFMAHMVSKVDTLL